MSNPVSEGLVAQHQDGTLDYPSENAVWIGLARFQLLIGKQHTITVAIARMHADDEKVIDDFLLEVATRGLSLRGGSFPTSFNAPSPGRINRPSKRSPSWCRASC